MHNARPEPFRAWKSRQTGASSGNIFSLPDILAKVNVGHKQHAPTYETANLPETPPRATRLDGLIPAYLALVMQTDKNLSALQLVRAP